MFFFHEFDLACFLILLLSPSIFECFHHTVSFTPVILVARAVRRARDPWHLDLGVELRELMVLQELLVLGQLWYWL